MNNRWHLLILIILLILFISHPTHACDVPVYRYALERWVPDTYEIAIFHNGPLNAESQKILNAIPKTANVRHRWIDTTQPIPAGIQAIQPQQSNTIVLRNIQSGESVWSAPFTAQSINQLLQSPARQAIIQRLLDGESAVWVQLESGDQKRDDAVANLLKAQLDIQAKTLELPIENPELQIAFSTIRFSRTDPNEQAFIQMLLSSESDLADRQAPMVFPIFGRGRVLYALIGSGITPANIQEACVFLIGPCACEVKDDNPGIDLLVTADWQANIQTLISETTLPSIAQMSQAVSNDTTFKPIIHHLEIPQENTLGRNIGFTLLIGIGGIIGASVLIYLKKS